MVNHPQHDEFELEVHSQSLREDWARRHGQLPNSNNDDDYPTLGRRLKRKCCLLFPLLVVAVAGTFGYGVYTGKLQLHSHETEKEDQYIFNTDTGEWELPEGVTEEDLVTEEGGLCMQCHPGHSPGRGWAWWFGFGGCECYDGWKGACCGQRDGPEEEEVVGGGTTAPSGAPVPEYLPILIMHGIQSDAAFFEKMIADFDERGQFAYAFPIYEGTPDSWMPLNSQVDELAHTIRGIVKGDPYKYRNGYHLLCHSQGALICRCVIEMMNDHNIHTFVSMAGPQLGVYDEHFFEFFPDELAGAAGWTLENMHTIAYGWLMQSTMSVANMWNDPFEQEEFLGYNYFLPYYNNLIEYRADYRTNFLKLKKAAFLVGEVHQDKGHNYEGGIGPWQSAVFGYYDATMNKIIEMKDQKIYKEDLFGLKTMDDRKDLTIKVTAGTTHNQWVSSSYIYKTHIFPLLEVKV